MDNRDLDRFLASDAFAGNQAKKKRSRAGIGAWSCVMTGLFTLCAVGGLLYILHADPKAESSFEELITTGGAVRRRSLESASQRNSLNPENAPEDASVPVANELLTPINKTRPYELKTCTTKECLKLATYIKRSMNMSVNPCDNFYKFACDGWIKRNPIPKTSSTFSTFSKLNQEVERILHKILNSTMDHDPKILKKAKKFYRSCMAQDKINKKGKGPMIQLVKYLGSWSIANDDTWDRENWKMLDVLLKIQQEFTSSGGPLVSVHVSDDPVHSERHILEVRDHYFS